MFHFKRFYENKENQVLIGNLNKVRTRSTQEGSSTRPEPPGARGPSPPAPRGPPASLRAPPRVVSNGTQGRARPPARAAIW